MLSVNKKLFFFFNLFASPWIEREECGTLYRSVSLSVSQSASQPAIHVKILSIDVFCDTSLDKLNRKVAMAL